MTESSTSLVDRAARFLFDAHSASDTYRPLPPELTPGSLEGPEGAYAIQDALIDLWCADTGQTVAGYKIALTSKPMQEMCGIDHPIAGTVLSGAVRQTNAVMAMDEHIHAGVEFELCVTMAEDLPLERAPFDLASVGLAVADCLPAFEIIEDRGADYAALDVATLAADNAWNDGVVLGRNTGDWHRLDLSSTPVRLMLDEQEAGVTDTGAAMGHPFEAVVWIANNLAARGKSLKAGQLIMTGSTLPTRFPEAGHSLRYEIEGLGMVDLMTVRSAAHCAGRSDATPA